jgi:hypothetical protein
MSAVEKILTISGIPLENSVWRGPTPALLCILKSWILCRTVWLREFIGLGTSGMFLRHETFWCRCTHRKPTLPRASPQTGSMMCQTLLRFKLFTGSTDPSLHGMKR